MINERDRHIWRPIAASTGPFCDAQRCLFPAVSRQWAWRHMMTGAIGVTSLLCYVVARRSQNRRAISRSSGDSPTAADTGCDGNDNGQHHGGAPILLDRTIPATPAIPAGAIARAAAMQEAAATAVVVEAVSAAPANKMMRSCACAAVALELF
jgi:hypothetical protein